MSWVKCRCNKVNKPENQFNVNLFHKNIKENSNFVLMLDFPETLNWIVYICNNKWMLRIKIEEKMNNIYLVNSVNLIWTSKLIELNQ